MTVLEQRFMEVTPSVLRDIAKAIESLAQEVKELKEKLEKVEK